MNDNEDIPVASAAPVVTDSVIQKKHTKKTTSRRLLLVAAICKNRKFYSIRDVLNDLKLNQTLQFSNFCRISSSDFENLINLVGPIIGKRFYLNRNTIPIKTRLAVTFSFLATGESYSALAYFFKMSNQSISKIVPEVCEALIESLQQYVKVNIMYEWN